MLKIVSSNPNYLAQVVRLLAPRNHSNADRLQCFNVKFNNVISDLTAKENDLYVYFPLECALDKQFLSDLNLFSDVSLNKDKTKKGYFPSAGRVKCLKLRGERSEGLILPVSQINEWFKEEVITEKDVDTEFDTINDKLFVTKYQIPIKNTGTPRNLDKKIKRESRIVDLQYRIAEDTVQLKRYIHDISPEDYITVAYKAHGCNFSVGKVLCKRPLKWYEKFLKSIGVKIDDKEYSLVFASRRVVKNEFADKESNHFYEEDIWSRAAQRISDKIQNTVNLHCEIVGFLSTGAAIQNGYDYNCGPNEFDIYVYRGFTVAPTGEVFEFTTPQLIKYCDKNGLKTVPIFYYGRAKDKYTEIKVDENWHQNFLANLIRDYTEKDCFICKNKVPEEGICLIKNDNYFQAAKLKSFNFLSRESAELDKGNENIEDLV